MRSGLERAAGLLRLVSGLPFRRREVVSALACEWVGRAGQDGRASQTYRAARAFIVERINQTPQLSLHRLKEELAARGVKVSHDTVWQFLRREGLRFKKNAVRP